MSVDREHQLFRILPVELLDKIERSVYNRRKRKLFPFIEQIRVKLSDLFNEFEDYYLIDSIPLEVCKLSRSTVLKLAKNKSKVFQIKGIALLKG